jgi:hypothetical protein
MALPSRIPWTVEHAPYKFRLKEPLKLPFCIAALNTINGDDVRNNVSLQRQHRADLVTREVISF